MQRRTVLRLLSAGMAAARLENKASAQACVPAGRVAILGGGVSGMSAAHELAERGFEVSVFELRDIPGGKARSMPKPGSGVGGRRDLPGEHGFRFFPGFYKHLPDVMARIPSGPYGMSAADHLVPATRFLLSQANAPDAELPVRQRTAGDLWSALQFFFGPNVTNVPFDEIVFFYSRLDRFLRACDRRRFDEFERMSWWDFVEGESRSEGYRKFLASGLTRTLVAARAELMSARSAASVFVQLLQDIILNDDGMDRVLDGPTNEVWIDPWQKHLESMGVHYYADARVDSLEYADGRVRAVNITRGGETCRIAAELFVSALPVEVIRRLLTPAMVARDPQLGRLSSLQTEWMNGIQFYLDRDIPVVHGHATFFDSPWALTAVSQKQFWPNVDLSAYGDGSVRGVLSIDISDWEAEGIVYGKPARACTADEIREEVWTQLATHWDDDVGAQFRAARIVDVHLDPAITFSAAGADNQDPLLVNTVGSWNNRPEAVTAIPNFFLAGDFVRTYTDLATMESANESARRAVNGILQATRSRATPCALWRLSEPLTYVPARALDDLRYTFGLPMLY
jgi:uncharacterized protein with NAD-binding domain and iron-sulfur cluster